MGNFPRRIPRAASFWANPLEYLHVSPMLALGALLPSSTAIPLPKQQVVLVYLLKSTSEKPSTSDVAGFGSWQRSVDRFLPIH